MSYIIATKPCIIAPGIAMLLSIDDHHFDAEIHARATRIAVRSLECAGLSLEPHDLSELILRVYASIYTNESISEESETVN